MAFTLTYKNIDSTTEKYFIPKLIDNFFLSSALLYKLKQNEDPVDGGERIMQPISYTSHPNAGAWPGKAGTLRTTYVEHITAAEFYWSNYYCDVTLPETELLRNSGSGTKVIDLLKAQMELAEESLRDTMGTHVYGSNTVASDGSRVLNGLQSVITVASDPSGGSYGGITRVGATASTKASPTGNAFWNSNTVAINAGTYTGWRGTFTFSNADTILDLTRMEMMFLACSANNESPDLIVMHPTLYQKFWGLQQAMQRTASDNELGRVGFKYLLFNGVPVVTDDNIDAATRVYFLNTKHLFLRPHRQSNFVTTPFQNMPNQRMRVKFIYWDGQMTCDRPNLQGVLTAVTPA
jgi:hypothetical protein